MNDADWKDYIEKRDQNRAIRRQERDVRRKEREARRKEREIRRIAREKKREEKEKKRELASELPVITLLVSDKDTSKEIETLQLRQDAYNAYCTYIAQGNNKNGFFFSKDTDKGKYQVDSLYVARMILESPTEFNPKTLQQAKALCFDLWFQTGKGIALGKMKRHALSAGSIWQTMMIEMFRNEYGWGAEEVREIHLRTSADDVLDGMHSHVKKLIEIGQVITEKTA